MLSNFNFPAGPMRTVIVHLADGAQYTLSLDIMMHVSGYFRQCFANEWYRYGVTDVRLSDERFPAVFHLLQEWLARGGPLAVHQEEEVVEDWPFTDRTSTDTQKPTWKQSVDLWLLGDQLRIPLLQNYLIDLMCQKLRRDPPSLPPVQLLRYTYDAIGGDSIQDPQDPRDRQRVVRDFIFEVMTSFRGYTPGISGKFNTEEAAATETMLRDLLYSFEIERNAFDVQMRMAKARFEARVEEFGNALPPNLDDRKQSKEGSCRCPGSYEFSQLQEAFENNTGKEILASDYYVPEQN
ncbi:hypothetical protein F4780DRAFT_778409 [Xylariomycetidae sp. FL0641]|nr:hypothetical protein F4780DRAFT_778409 [Xylariomycetidae sp. FL0641]